MEISEELITQADILIKIVIACMLGGIVGIERELSQKPAGFRTNMLIAGSAALFICISKDLVFFFQDVEIGEKIATDPVRVLQAIIVGISFIGAGTILKQSGEESILYLTTAATILFSTGIGIAVALEQYYLASGLVIIVFTVNRIIKYFERKATSKNPSKGDEEES